MAKMIKVGTINFSETQTSGNQYEITETLTNLTSGNKTIQITPDTGYYLPSSITVTNGTLVSYNSTTGIAVISGDNAVVTVECSDTQAVSGYSGNILASVTPSGNSLIGSIYIKFGSAPTSVSDYDAMLSATQGATIQGITSFTNQTVAYLFTTTMVPPSFTYNNTTVDLTREGNVNGIPILTYCGYNNPYELQLTGNYDITLNVGYPSGGGSND